MYIYTYIQNPYIEYIFFIHITYWETERISWNLSLHYLHSSCIQGRSFVLSVTSDRTYYGQSLSTILPLSFSHLFACSLSLSLSLTWERGSYAVVTHVHWLSTYIYLANIEDTCPVVLSLVATLHVNLVVYRLLLPSTFPPLIVILSERWSWNCVVRKERKAKEKKGDNFPLVLFIHRSVLRRTGVTRCQRIQSRRVFV